MIKKYLFYFQEQIEILHEHGLVHGNLNPNYIALFSSNEEGIIILDAFRSNIELKNGQLKRKRLKFNRNYKYSSPSIILNKREARREDDFFSLGMIAIEMCFGVIPFDMKEYFSISKNNICNLFKRKNYSQELVDIITELIIGRKELDFIHRIVSEQDFNERKERFMRITNYKRRVQKCKKIIIARKTKRIKFVCESNFK